MEVKMRIKARNGVDGRDVMRRWKDRKVEKGWLRRGCLDPGPLTLCG